MVYPNTTAVSTQTQHEKRYLWWVLGGACKCLLKIWLFSAFFVSVQEKRLYSLYIENHMLILLLSSVRTVQAGFGIYQLVTSCQSWAGSSQTDDSTKIGCVYGAISTLIVVAGAAWAGAAKLFAIGAKFVELTKRDVSLQNDATLLFDYQVAMVNTTGLALAPMFNMDGGLMVHNKSGMPLMFGYNPRGDGMVFTHTLSQVQTLLIWLTVLYLHHR